MLAVIDADGVECENGQENDIDIALLKIDPIGNETLICDNLCQDDVVFPNSCLGLISQEINSIINEGYKLMAINSDDGLIDNGESDGDGYSQINKGTVFIFAIPWNPSGLEEVPQTLTNQNIYPNPANKHVNFVLDYDLLTSSEIVIYNDAGYIIHKETVTNLIKNEPYRLDISKVPAGKYLITIVNNKTFITPYKLIVI